MAEWLAYDRIEPFGEQRADLRAGIVACTIANHLGNAEQAHTPADFMPYVETAAPAPRHPDDDKQLSQALRTAFMKLNAKRTKEQP